MSAPAPAWLQTAALALALLAALPSRADEARAQVEQRIRLAAQLIADSPTSQRITGSGNTRAVSHLEEGRLHHSMAEDALRRSDVATARAEVDEALRHVGLALRLVPNTKLQQAAAQRRHEQLLASLERLVEAWRGQSLADDVQDGDLVAAVGLIGTARYFAEAGRPRDAVFTLELAEKHVLSGMNRTLQQREVDYTQRASTPEQEFQLELQRHQAMAELLPLALADLKPSAEALKLIERYTGDSRSLRGQALQLQQAGDTSQALARLRNAMLFLQRSLHAAGLSTPTAPEGRP